MCTSSIFYLTETEECCFSNPVLYWVIAVRFLQKWRIIIRNFVIRHATEIRDMEVLNVSPFNTALFIIPTPHYHG